MRFLIKILLIALLSYLSYILLPWWAGAVCSFLVCLVIHTRGFISFLSGFLGVGLLWFTVAWIVHSDTDGILSTRVATIFTLDSPFLLVVISSLLGGLSGGLGGLSGHMFRKLFVGRKRKSTYYGK
ncbi:MAG: hypothetical protein WBB45_10735 [Cyclobacteriaceae bacterium]